jgi:hypothetical protein
VSSVSKRIAYGLLTTAKPLLPNPRYSWVKNKQSSKRNTIVVELLSKYYNISKREAQLYIEQIEIDDESIIDIAKQLGLSKDEVKKIKKALKNK